MQYNFQNTTIGRQSAAVLLTNVTLSLRRPKAAVKNWGKSGVHAAHSLLTPM